MLKKLFKRRNVRCIVMNEEDLMTVLNVVRKEKPRTLCMGYTGWDTGEWYIAYMLHDGGYGHVLRELLTEGEIETTERTNVFSFKRAIA